MSLSVTLCSRLTISQNLQFLYIVAIPKARTPVIQRKNKAMPNDKLKPDVFATLPSRLSWRLFNGLLDISVVSGTAAGEASGTFP